MSTRRFGRYTFEATNEDKLLFTADGISKADVIGYYENIGHIMSDMIRGRILTLERFPDGIGEEGFFQQRPSSNFPDWIETMKVSLQSENGTIEHMIARRTADLAYFANQGTIAFHCWLSKADRPDHPDKLLFDLDPPDKDFAIVRDGARAFKSLFDAIDVPSFVKITGGRGVHVVVPLDRSADFDTVRDIAARIASYIEATGPDKFTVAQRKADRGNRLYLDISRNAFGQTSVAPYSLRAASGAPVAAPLFWHELLDGNVHPGSCHIGNMSAWLGRNGEPWSRMMRHARSAKRIAKAFDAYADRHPPGSADRDD